MWSQAGGHPISKDPAWEHPQPHAWEESTHGCETLSDPMDYSLPGSCIHGIVQARVLEWGAIAFSRGSSPPRDQTWVSSTAGRLSTI